MGNEIQAVSAACEDATRALRQASSGFIRMQASGFVWRRGLIVTSRLRALAGLARLRWFLFLRTAIENIMGSCQGFLFCGLSGELI